MATIPNALMLERIEFDWPGRDEVDERAARRWWTANTVPDAPGLGVDIDEGAVARYPSACNVSIAGGGYKPGTENEHVYVQTRLHAGYLRPEPAEAEDLP